MLEIESVFLGFSVPCEIAQVDDRDNTGGKSAVSAHNLQCLPDPGISKELSQYSAALSPACQGKERLQH